MIGPTTQRNSIRNSAGKNRLALLLVSVAVFVTSCSSSEGGAPAAESSSSPESAQTTTTMPPVMLAFTPNLDLAVGECWSELPPPAETTTTIPTTTEFDPNATAETVPAPLGDPDNTVPTPTIVARVDCEGSNEGQVFATFCLGQNPTGDDPTQPTLIAVVCDPESVVPWPGDRIVRRAAARICLVRFEQYYQESYSESEFVVQEFVPTEGIWDRGLHTVVCWIEPTT